MQKTKKPQVDFSEVVEKEEPIKNSKASGYKSTKGPTDKQVLILNTKLEHPDLTAREVAKVADTTHPHVIRTLRQYGIDTTRDVELYKRHRADILAGLQADSVETYYKLSDEDKRKMLMSRGLVDMGIAFDKERLERDLSTVNVVNVIADLEALRKARNPLVGPHGIELSDAVTGAGDDT